MVVHGEVEPRPLGVVTVVARPDTGPEKEPMLPAGPVTAIIIFVPSRLVRRSHPSAVAGDGLIAPVLAGQEPAGERRADDSARYSAGDRAAPIRSCRCCARQGKKPPARWRVLSRFCLRPSMAITLAVPSAAAGDTTNVAARANPSDVPQRPAITRRLGCLRARALRRASTALSPSRPAPHRHCSRPVLHDLRAVLTRINSASPSVY